MKRVLLLQPSLQPPGGGNGVAVRVIESLLPDYDLTVLAWEAPRVGAINEYWGLSLRDSDFKVLLVPLWLRALRRILGVRMALLQRYVLMRMGRRLADAFDLTISVNNEIDIGRRAVQYVHFPWGFLPRPDDELRWYHRLPGALAAYYRIGHQLSPVSEARVSRNRTLVNSDWTGARFRDVYGGRTDTVYPPVIAPGASLPWEQREAAFLAIGVMERHKRFEQAIAIVERLRSRGHDVTLHIAGSRRDRVYERRIRDLAAARRGWVHMHLDLPRAALQELTGSVRYGLHAMPDEHFGIGIAEMVRGGCIVFVPDGGGQVEIVADPRLTYATEEEAVAKIAAVLGDAELQDALRAHLATRGAAFSCERFRDQIRAIVAEELARS